MYIKHKISLKIKSGYKSAGRWWCYHQQRVTKVTLTWRRTFCTRISSGPCCPTLGLGLGPGLVSLGLGSSPPVLFPLGQDFVLLPLGPGLDLGPWPLARGSLWTGRLQFGLVDQGDSVAGGGTEGWRKEWVTCGGSAHTAKCVTMTLLTGVILQQHPKSSTLKGHLLKVWTESALSVWSQEAGRTTITLVDLTLKIWGPEAQPFSILNRQKVGAALRQSRRLAASIQQILLVPTSNGL